MKAADFQAILAAMAAGIGWFFGGVSGLVYVLAAFSAVDYVTGVMVGAAKGSLSSKAGMKGIFRKAAVFAVVGVAALADRYVLGETGVLRGSVILFYVSNEGISILENATALGLPVPEVLRKAIGIRN